MNHPLLPLPLRLPAAAIFLWPERAGIETLADLAAARGALPLRDGVWAVVPVAGDGSVLDAAVAFGLGAVERLGGRAVVVPGRAQLVGDQIVLVEERFLESLEHAASLPGVPAGVLLTGHAVAALDEPWAVVAAGKLQLGPGEATPLSRVDPSAPPGAASSRNRTLPGSAPNRRIAPLSPPPLEGPRIAVVGPLGAGKTRLLVEAWPAEQRLVAAVRPSRRGLPLLEILAQRLAALPDAAGIPLAGLDAVVAALERLSTSDVTLVIDALENATEEDLELVDLIAGLYRPQLVLAGRPGAWQTMIQPNWQLIELAGLDPEQTRAQVAGIGEALSLPPSIRTSFLDTTAGNPWAVEEGLAEMLHRRELKALYGAYFYAGASNGGWRASPRWVAHVVAEAGRLGGDGDLLAATLVGSLGDDAPVGARVDHVGEAAQILGSRLASGWESRLAPLGIISSTTGPWGSGVVPASPAIALALTDAVRADGRDQAREALGIVLAGASRGGDAAWRSYRLLAGSAEGPGALLASLEERPPGLDAAELLDALCRELESHRQRGGAASIELELLWAMLPLAHKGGALGEHRADLERALELATSSVRRAALLALVAELAQQDGNLGDAAATLKAALELAVHESPKAAPTIAIQLIRVLLRQREFDAARHLATGVRNSLARHGPSGVLATCHFLLGNIALRLGDFEAALAAHEAGLEIRRALGLAAAVGASLSAIGSTHLRSGNLPSALEAFTAAESVLAEHGDGLELSWALLGRGRVLARLGRHIEAAAPQRRALELRTAQGNEVAIAIARSALAHNALSLGRLDEAERLAREALFAITLAEQGEEQAAAERLLGRIALARRRHDEARRHFREACRLDTLGASEPLAESIAGLLEVAMRESRAQEAAELVARLARRLLARPVPEAREHVDFLLYQAGQWLASKGMAPSGVAPRAVLERAWSELLRAAGFLSAEDRGTFLFRVAGNARIVEAATREGLAT